MAPFERRYGAAHGRLSKVERLGRAGYVLSLLDGDEYAALF